MLEEVGFSLNLPNMFVQPRAMLLGQKYCTMLVFFDRLSDDVIFNVYVAFFFSRRLLIVLTQDQVQFCFFERMMYRNACS